MRVKLWKWHTISQSSVTPKLGSPLGGGCGAKGQPSQSWGGGGSSSETTRPLPKARLPQPDGEGFKLWAHAYSWGAWEGTESSLQRIDVTRVKKLPTSLRSQLIWRLGLQAKLYCGIEPESLPLMDGLCRCYFSAWWRVFFCSLRSVWQRPIQNHHGLGKGILLCPGNHAGSLSWGPWLPAPSPPICLQN